eukprot:GHVU01013038.1.p1 GENE.GHVU01013038.1~~GHVU01013038.1.p1  ORF type:complete len:346 (-),score=50.01 GHVU01013038.1:449-1486(-)
MEAAAREIATQFGLYEEYLDSLLTERDRRYLSDPRLLVELGGRAQVTREEFVSLKRRLRDGKAAEGDEAANGASKGGIAKAGKARRVKNFSADLDLPRGSLEAELQWREAAIRAGKLLSVVFLAPISPGDAAAISCTGFIDLKERMDGDEYGSMFVDYNTGGGGDTTRSVAGGTTATAPRNRRPSSSDPRRLQQPASSSSPSTGDAILKPRPKDLSYSNFTTQKCLSSPSSNWEPLVKPGNGKLVFRCKADGQIGHVLDPSRLDNDSSGGTTNASSSGGGGAATIRSTRTGNYNSHHSSSAAATAASASVTCGPLKRVDVLDSRYRQITFFDYALVAGGNAAPPR